MTGLALGIVLVLGALALGAAFVLGGSEPTRVSTEQPVAAGAPPVPGPPSTLPPVTPTPTGAEFAEVAGEAVHLLGTPRMFDPESRLELLSDIATTAQAGEIAGRYESVAAQSSLVEAAAAGAPVWSASIPAAWRIAQMPTAADPRAIVQVWTAQVAVAGAERPQAGWVTTTVTLARERDAWLVDDLSWTAGPSPTAGEDFPGLMSGFLPYRVAAR